MLPELSGRYLYLCIFSISLCQCVPWGKLFRHVCETGFDDHRGWCCYACRAWGVS